MFIVVLGILIASSFATGGFVLTVLSAPLLACSALMPFIGAIFGYILSWLFRLNPPERRTVAMETGCQNTQLCATILKLAFPMDLLGPLFLFPMVQGFFQLTEGMLLVVLFRAHQRFTLKEKEKYRPAITEDQEAADV